LRKEVLEQIFQDKDSDDSDTDIGDSDSDIEAADIEDDEQPEVGIMPQIQKHWTMTMTMSLCVMLNQLTEMLTTAS